MPPVRWLSAALPGMLFGCAETADHVLKVARPGTRRTVFQLNGHVRLGAVSSPICSAIVAAGRTSPRCVHNDKSIVSSPLPARQTLAGRALIFPEDIEIGARAPPERSLRGRCRHRATHEGVGTLSAGQGVLPFAAVKVSSPSLPNSVLSASSPVSVSAAEPPRTVWMLLDRTQARRLAQAKVHGDRGGEGL